ncbi:MAG TPA: oxidoreductase [Planctomycetaceae bacterium]|nr:oxidoreductase [Planctomycetaceae bacterium]
MNSTHKQASDSPVILITGSGKRRVGNVVAEHFATLGYRIALHYHSSREEALDSRQRLLKEGADCEIFSADVSNEDQVNEMMQHVHSHFGALDVLVTTASIWSKTAWDEITPDQILRNFEINTLGTFLCARAAGNVMINQPKGGSIITIGDWAIERPYLDHAPYFLSKGAIPTLTRVLAVELAERNPNIRVNCIHPGPVMFPPGTTEAEAEELIQSTLLKKANCPEMVAHAVEGFVRNQFITGTCLPVDGGRSMHAPSEKRRQ